MAEPQEPLVDPAVSRKKFEREVASLLDQRWDLHRRGWFVMDTAFPKVFVIFAKPDMPPMPVVFGVEIDFTNYDLEPPSVVLVDPFTREPYTGQELASKGVLLLHLKPGENTLGNFLQAETPDAIPFICFPGTREYHRHPAHTGDSWLLHRGRGEGRLYFLLEKLFEHGVVPLSGFEAGLQIQIGRAQYDPGKLLS